MGVEGRDLIDFGECQFHLGGERSKMRSRQISVVILNKVQVLDQEVSSARAVSQERAHFHQGLWIDLAALWRARRAPSALALRPALGGRKLFRNAHFSPFSRKNAVISGSASPLLRWAYRKFLLISALLLFFSIMVAQSNKSIVGR